jgi:XisI protein
MDPLDQIRSIIESVLDEYTKIPYAYGDIQTEAVFDRKHDRYLLVNVGWHDDKRIHGGLVHIDIVDGKIWIQRDGLEHGVAKDLVRAGIPRDQIVLAFRSQEMQRQPSHAIAE